ncbi:uncharacterized protein Dwil_GK17818 [Drosophila willistoni]|uniref:Uncharacterized protein n=1 Tax=Drosophila willistoni TaxID=7260 RepID=B4N628_DROWI|nr:uncharacterized protein Dwil_GK17818 [Drosophila willistoni]
MAARSRTGYTVNAAWGAEPLSLPDEPLFNTKNKADRTNWLVRDKHAALEDIPKYKNVDASASALTAPYNREEELAIESYVYTTQSTTNSKRIYYVDVLEAEETFLVGTQTNEFSDNHLKVTVISMDTDDKKILLLKNGRSTNQRSLVWENIVIATAATATTRTLANGNVVLGAGSINVVQNEKHSDVGSHLAALRLNLPLAWQQQQQRNQFGRNSRNFLRRSGSSSSSSLADAAAGGGGGGDALRQQQQQTEVYGIVEPLIEDTPCADRACLVNDDCCPTGVCVNTYGEGKCVYVFGRKRDDDQCQRHSDCPTGSLCTLSNQEEAGGGAIWHCEASLMQELFGIKQKHSLGSECTSSSDCQLNIGMCCQQQRLHHRAMTKLSCGYFRDAFDCIDMAEHRNI